MSVELVEEGFAWAPQFDADGLLPFLTADANAGEALKLGYMRDEALQRMTAPREARCWGRSRQCPWRKGTTSGLI